MPKYLCLDLGTAHTGLAVSEEGILASPFDTIFEKNQDRLVGKLLPFIAKLSPDFLVIGIPKHGPMVEYVEALKVKLEKIFAGTIVLFPEDNTSTGAKILNRDSHKPVSKRIQQEHQTAAALILQEYLDTL